MSVFFSHSLLRWRNGDEENFIFFISNEKMEWVENFKKKNCRKMFTKSVRWNIILCYWIWNYMFVIYAGEFFVSENDCFYILHRCCWYSVCIWDWNRWILGKGNEWVEGMFFLIALWRQIWYDKHSCHVKWEKKTKQYLTALLVGLVWGGNE